MTKYIVFDCGGTKIKHGIINANGELLTKDAYKTVRDNLAVFLDNMLLTIRNYQQNHDIAGIAISMPGYVDIDTGYLERAGAITALDGQNMKQLLEAEFSLPVEIENDGNCVALAEKISGNAQECQNFVCMTIGTGIGGGLYLNGDIYRGYRYRAGEYGAMLTAFHSECMLDMHVTASFSKLLFTYKAYKKVQGHVEGAQIFAEAMTDTAVKELVDQWIQHISRGVYNLAVTLNPEKILIGGGVSAQTYLLEEINRQLEKYELWQAFKIPVEPCHYRNDAGLLGAFYHFQKMQ
ncbi:ROK family protein [Lysinibacillus piscis]|uniref:Transcriptional regulator n=1 Tax=Lysinibacillus piscis TaxID=2518931 RepID=A0ABQ5NNI0_9BACI|nr:ROK family protein [Lysinibacillus sp. KH24]GLC89554.1 transcriptional regulator [Lysinibacillus sp. KH24]